MWLARSYGLGTEEVLDQYVCVLLVRIQQEDLVAMGVLKVEDGSTVLVDPHIPQGGWVQDSEPDTDPDEDNETPPAATSSETQELKKEICELKKMIQDQQQHMLWMGDCLEQLMARSNVQPRRPPPHREPEDVDSNI